MPPTAAYIRHVHVPLTSESHVGNIIVNLLGASPHAIEGLECEVEAV